MITGSPEPASGFGRVHLGCLVPQRVERSISDAIDVVVAWVDGLDPRHRAKRNGIWPIRAGMPRSGAGGHR